uniref:Uncharacterized protein n=1 Tax=Salix viminalis TaxID=40686 RepID=A0A6N2KJI6_SALVM
MMSIIPSKLREEVNLTPCSDYGCRRLFQDEKNLYPIENLCSNPFDRSSRDATEKTTAKTSIAAGTKKSNDVFSNLALGHNPFDFPTLIEATH